MKRGYHSTQSKIYGSIPRSEFYGFVLGYALGTILRGVFNLGSNTLSLALAVVGLAVGIWVDRKYFMVKDEPEEKIGEVLLEKDILDGDASHGSGQQKMQPEDENISPEGTGEVSMQRHLKQMFGKNQEMTD